MFSIASGMEAYLLQDFMHHIRLRVSLTHNT